LKTWIRRHQLLSFFGIAYAIMYGVLFGFIFINPGQPLQPWSLVWFLSIFSPTFSALLVSWIVGGTAGISWYLAAAFLFFGPLVIALIYVVVGNPAAGLKPGVTIPVLLGQVLFVLFSGPIAEEAGWRGFALPRLQARFNALVSSLILGVIWTCWHLPLFFLTGAAQIGIPFPFYLLLVVTLAIYFTWLYNNTRGSLIVTVLAHFSFNLTGTLITGSVSLMPPMLFYMTASPLLGLIVIAVVIFFGPRKFSKKPAGELPVQP
jgi:CAAX protease family protein